MAPLEFAWLLLSFPASALAVFSGLIIPISTTYWITELLDRLPPPYHANARTLHHSILRWWSVTRAIWRISRRHSLKRFILHPLVFVCAVATAAIGGIGAALGAVIPYVLVRQLLDRPASVSYLVIIAGGGVGVGMLFECVRYALWPRRLLMGALPRLEIWGSDVSYRQRLGAAREVYSYLHMRIAVNLAVVIGPISFYTGVWAGGDRASDPGGFSLGDALVIADFLLIFVLRYSLLRYIDFLMIKPKAVAHLSGYSPFSLRSQDNSYAGIRDDHLPDRKALDRNAELLSRLARRVDASSPFHPVASILLATSLALRSWLSNVDSMSVTMSSAIEGVQRKAIAVIVGPRRTSYYRSAALAVEAIDANGKPQSGLRDNPSGRMDRGAVLRLAEHLETYAKIATAIWAIFSMAVVTYLILSGRLDITKWQLQK
ncbi:hypothetical protein [Actinoplanes sp. NPDC049599]|uniref:hypothetical protein n=1 Tax=Actinoplanes sp. NPDC049599 TaxID=3363903 RepID=UPI0037A654C8